MSNIQPPMSNTVDGLTHSPFELLTKLSGEVAHINVDLKETLNRIRENHEMKEEVIRKKKEIIDAFKSIRQAPLKVRAYTFKAYYSKVCPKISVNVCVHEGIITYATNVISLEETSHDIFEPLYLEEIVKALFGTYMKIEISDKRYKIRLSPF